jgi:hypothetical protein
MRLIFTLWRRVALDMLMVWRGAPPPTMAEILHEVDRRD